MKLKIGSNRIVIVGKEYVYKFPILYRGILANKNEYENFCRNVDLVAYTQRHWWGLKQERLADLLAFPRYAQCQDIPEALKELYSRKIHNRMQVGKDKYGCWKFYDYEDVKFYLKGETEFHEGVKQL